jgi:hypothetical protein
LRSDHYRTLDSPVCSSGVFVWWVVQIPLPLNLLLDSSPALPSTECCVLFVWLH